MSKYQEALDTLLPCHSICGHQDRNGNYISCDECGTKKIKDTLQELIDMFNEMTMVEEKQKEVSK